MFLLTPAQVEAADFFVTFGEFDPSQRAASFLVDEIQAQLEDQLSGMVR